MNSKSVNLIVPGLFNGFQESEVNIDTASHSSLIQKLVSKADSRECSEAEYFSADYLQHYPLAYYEYMAEVDDAPAQTVLYATPVSLDLKSDHIVAMPLSIDPDQQHKLSPIVEKFNQHFEEDGLSLRLLPSGKLLCISTRHAAAKMAPVHAVYGRDIKHFLPAGENARFWLRIFNETQMLLHEYFDKSDRAFNQKELNSFWFWGAAQLTQQQIPDAAFIGKPDWLAAYCKFNAFDHYELSELAKLSEADNKPLYIIDESLLPASSSGDFEAWLKALSDLESNLLQTLFQLLKRGQLQQINIHSSATECFQFKYLHRLRFYRKNKTISELCVKPNE